VRLLDDLGTKTMLRDHDKQLSKLENLFRAGKECLKIGRDPQLRAELAKRFGLTLKMLTLAKQFASQYTEEEFAELIRLRKPDGKPLNTGYIPWLLSMPWRTETDRQTRTAFQKEIAERGLTAPETRTELHRRWPNPSSVSRGPERRGRKRKGNKDPDLVRQEAIGKLTDLIATASAAGACTLFPADVVSMALALKNRLRKNPQSAAAA
jgi:hypothetical protein